MGRAEDVAKKIRIELEKRGLHKEPLGVDIVEPDVMVALQREGIEIVNGHALMCEAREIKTEDEITLLNMAAMMVDAAYYDLYKAMKPGMRENEAVALVAERLYDMGSEYVEGVNAISGERCSPHPHLFSDRALRPAIRCTTTSFTPTWAIAPATTGLSRWLGVARARRCLQAVSRLSRRVD
jgi:Xaa-Pro aminopeptidase